MVKAFFFGLSGIFISVLIISISGVFLPKTNFHQFSLFTIFFVGFYGPFVEETIRTPLAVSLFKNASLSKALIFGLSWALLEEVLQLAQATNFFNTSVGLYYDFPTVVSSAGTRLMHLVCGLLAMSSWMSFKSRLSFSLLVHSSHNLLTIFITHYAGFNYTDKTIKIFIYILLILFLSRMLLKKKF